MRLQDPEWLFAIIPLAILIFIMMKSRMIRIKNKAMSTEYELLRAKKRPVTFLMIATRIIIVFLLLLALASPFVIQQRVVPGNQAVTILVDNSKSFEIFDKSVSANLKNQLEKHFPVQLKNFGNGEISALGDGLFTNIRGNDNIILVTDGNANQGHDLNDVIIYASSLNSTIHALRVAPQSSDASVRILGPSKTVAEVDNTFVVEIDNPTGANVGLKVTVDGRTVIDRVTMELTQTFSKSFGSGMHEIQAEIVSRDYFPQNNVYYKSVQVVPKPNVLYVNTKPSPLIKILNELYLVDELAAIPTDISKYSAVILNDIPNPPDGKVDQLSNYVIDGNGLVVIGGESSYDLGKYENSFFETLLPVKVGLGSEIEGDINVVILLDISLSMAGTYSRSGGSSTLADFAKAQTISVLQDLRPQDRVGIIAYNSQPFVIANLAPLEEQYEKIVDKISSLVTGGGTQLNKALQLALDTLGGRSGASYITILSDGGVDRVGISRKLIEKAASQGIRVFTIGVGERVKNKFLEDFARRGYGSYLKPNSSQSLRMAFGRAPQDEKGELRDVFAVAAVDDGHFITKFLDLNASIAGYNLVAPKGSARMLVATEQGYPVLTVWRFGLGKVVSMSTDDGTKWAGRLLSAQNSQVISRSINWAIGDLNRRSSIFVDIPDTNIDKPVEILVRAAEKPSFEGVEFSKIDKNLYSATYLPMNLGFNTILGKKFAVNYPSEYDKIGFNEELNQTIKNTGGKILDLDDIDELVQIIKTGSKRIKTDYVYYRWPLVALALIIFLLEVCVRRLTENRKF